MWGTILAAAINAASSIYGGLKSSQAAQEANKKVEAMQRENQNWYDRRYNEDPLQRSSAQRVLTRTQEMLRDRNKAAAGRAAVMGGTEESVAAEKARNNEALAEAASRIAAQGDAQKDAIEQQYRATKAGLTQQQIGVEQQRAQNIAAATAGVGQAAGSLAAGFDGDVSSEGDKSLQPQAQPTAVGNFTPSNPQRNLSGDQQLEKTMRKIRNTTLRKY